MATLETIDENIGYRFVTIRRNRQLAGVFLLAMAAGFLTVIMLAAAMVPGYSLNEAAISDLGVIESTAMLFNVSLVVVGLFNVLVGLFLYREHGRRWLLSIFGIAGIGAIGAGLVPLDSGGLHGLFALLAFLFFNLEAIAMATRVAGPMKAVSVVAGVLGLVFVVVMAIGDAGNPAVFGPIGHGGAERLIVYPPMIWALAMGGYLMAPRSGDEPTASSTA